jgi:hypothetical protein
LKVGELQVRACIVACAGATIGGAAHRMRRRTGRRGSLAGGGPLVGAALSASGYGFFLTR